MKTNKAMAVPRLRFPEFKGDGDWEDISLNDICHFVRGPFGGALKKDIFVEDGYAVYEQSHAIYGDFNSFRYFINKDKFNELKRFEVKENDLIMSCSGTMGKFSRIPTNPKKGVINQALLKLTVKKGFDTSFIKTALELPLNQNKLLSQSAGGAVKNVVGVKLIKQINIAIPDINEQQKIANCLSSLDNLITSESEQLDALKSHKAGLLQQLFPADGETVPKLRFGEFKVKWESLDFNKVYKLKVTNSLSRAKLNYTSGEIKNIHYGDIHTGFSTLFDINKEEVPFINDDETNYKSETNDFCIAGDIIIADASEDIKDIGKAIEIVNVGNEKVVCGLHTIHARPKKNKMYTGFGGYLFQSSYLRKQIQLESQGAKVLGLSKGRLEKINLMIPNIKEQQKIADCLSSLDDLIQTKSNKIEALKLHKKGLMQQLFPSSENPS